MVAAGLKRSIDIIFSAAALLLLLPLLLLLILLIRLKLGSPILFTQIRAGLNGRPFRIVKFRTMTDARDGDGNLLPDHARLTPFGRALRASSLDELPEFWNVLKGNMSIVGPRPLLMQYLPLYSPEQARRHLVRPGITGWAQVNGRNTLSWSEKFVLDVWYIEHQNLWLDFKILLMTFRKVLMRDGISIDNEVTMPVFTGNGEASL